MANFERLEGYYEYSYNDDLRALMATREEMNPEQSLRIERKSKYLQGFANLELASVSPEEAKNMNDAAAALVYRRKLEEVTAERNHLSTELKVVRATKSQIADDEHRRELETLNEQLTQASERTKALESEKDSNDTKIKLLEDEVSTLKTRHSEALGKIEEISVLKSQHSQAIAGKDSEISALNESHKLELSSKAQDLSTLQDQHKQDLLNLQDQHKQDLSALQKEKDDLGEKITRQDTTLSALNKDLKDGDNLLQSALEDLALHEDGLEPSSFLPEASDAGAAARSREQKILDAAFEFATVAFEGHIIPKLPDRAKEQDILDWFQDRMKELQALRREDKRVRTTEADGLRTRAKHLSEEKEGFEREAESWKREAKELQAKLDEA
ncbi:hypothetical protein BDV96DRAFT_607112 [Lophiotrema nucula]|uniref:Uncharacterized protein n=1 Tax=Lophiotrema nucula TaxID=690887 RepID=A0A6A5YIQ4_9PLEO|nr:hypothetical protein BDV96DRAFT_607112 [Lophiotrema nucula]